jgi:hypothetical protein
MTDDLSAVQRYRSMASQFRVNATNEIDPDHRKELVELAMQYERMADSLITKHHPPR